MPESDRPLLRGNVLTLESIDGYHELLTIEADPMTDLHVGHIHVDVDHTDTNPYVNIHLDGKQYLKEFLLIDSSLRIDFGRNLLLNRTKKPVIIEIKKTATGSGTLIATAMVDGVETAKY